MSDSKISIAKTLVHEGGYVDNPNDSGGATKYGVEQRDMPNVNIADITPEQATEYYQEHYWKPFYSQIENQNVADKLFDMGVLFGIGTATKLLQNVLSLVVDGVFGPKTLSTVNQADSVSLLGAFQAALVSHALGIANAQPKDRVFLVGWIKRINS